MTRGPALVRKLVILLLALVISTPATAAAVASRAAKNTKSKDKILENSRAQKKLSSAAKKPRTTRKKKRRSARKRRYVERYKTSSFAQDQEEGDITAGEDPVVRAAALEALGNMNGTVVAIDPNSGRILAMVNQKLALSEGAIPCSTIKVPVALAALSEGIVSKDTPVALSRRRSMTLTQAIAVSNNPYFEVLGRRMGFEKVSYYARQFGLGELAGYDIEGEHLGTFPDAAISAKKGGVGKMCSFGEGISMTPLQLGALVSAIANGGTLYYLQHPQTPGEAATLTPRVKRYLDISGLIPEVQEGLRQAVVSGTARTLAYNFSEEPILGKTGTCSQNGTRFGWFASYANTAYGNIAVVVFLRGGRPTYGPKAAELAGRMYRNLYERSFFATRTATDGTTSTPAVGVSQ